MQHCFCGTDFAFNFLCPNNNSPTNEGSTMVRWQKFKVLVGIFSMVMLFGAVAHATVLTFDGNICIGGCAHSVAINQTYGDIAGQLDVVYTHRESNGNTAIDVNDLVWWDTQYSDLTNIAWGGFSDAVGVSEIALIPAAGFQVTLNGFDLGS